MGIKKAFIMVGLPGSGKSFKVAQILLGFLAVPTNRVCSTDEKFIVDGVYKFEPGKLPEFHQENLRGFVGACQEGIEVVFCDNTNLSIAEIAPYYAVAEAYGYETRIVYISADPEKAFKRNSHGVPEKAYPGMVARWEENRRLLPPWWNFTEA